QDEPNLTPTGGLVQPLQRASDADHHSRARRAVVGADEPLRLHERVVVGADDDAGLLARQGPDDVAQPSLARNRLEPPLRQHPPQPLGKPPKLRRPRGPLTNPDLLLDEPPRSIRVEPVDPQPTTGSLRIVRRPARRQGERADERARA